MKESTPTEAPAAKEAEGEASAGGDAVPEAPDETPVTSTMGATGASVVAATPPSPRAPSPAALAEEEGTEKALAKETPAIEETLTTEEAPAAGSTPTEEEAPTAGETPIEQEAPAAEKTPIEEEAPAVRKMGSHEEEEASMEQAKATVVPSPEAPIMGDEGARASPQRPEANSTPARSSRSGAAGGSAPSSSRGPAMDLGKPGGISCVLDWWVVPPEEILVAPLLSRPRTDAWTGLAQT
jgi:hypothetical protein